MLEAKPPFKFDTLQANLISLLLVGMLSAALLVISIGYRQTPLGILALAGTLALGLAIAIFVQPQLGGYILVVSVFSNISSILTDQGWPGINKPLMALVFLSLVARHLITHKSTFSLKRTEWFMLAYGAVALASIFVAEDRDIALNRVVDFGKDFLILLCIVYTLAVQPNSWKKAVWLIIITATILAGLGAYQTLSGNTSETFFGFSRFIQGQIVEGVEDRGRLSGPLDDPNFYGQILVAILPLVIYRLLDERQLWLKVGAGVSALLLALAILNTYSRGAFLAMIVVLALIALERRVKPSVLILIVLATLLLRQFLPAGFSERLETLSIFTNEEANVQSEVSFRGRSSEMLAGLEMFTDHPILGVGAGNYPVHYQSYASRLGLEHRTEDRQAHSLYIETATETGLLGLLAFGGLFVSLIVGLARARQKLKILPDAAHWSTWITSLQLALVAYLTSSFFLHGDYLRYLWLLVALGVALIHLADNLTPKIHPEPAAGANA